MLSLSAICMLVECGAIESCQTKIILGEVSGDPVENHTDPVLVTVVDKVLKILWRAVSAGNTKVTGGLISPATCKRVFANGINSTWVKFM